MVFDFGTVGVRVYIFRSQAKKSTSDRLVSPISKQSFFGAMVKLFYGGIPFEFEFPVLGIPQFNDV